MSTITIASKEWATRPAEERYWTLDDMRRAAETARQEAVEATVAPADLTVTATDEGALQLAGKAGTAATISHYAFGQLAARAKAPAGYLRSLPAPMAAECLQHGLHALATREDAKARLLFRRRHGALSVQAALSEKYARVWNADLLARVQDSLPEGWRPPPARPSPGYTGETRRATAADVSHLSDHLGLAVREGDEIGPAGLYMSDKDAFLFLINEDNPIDDGTGFPSFRGMMLWNSEVGDASLGGMTFLLKGVCGNHIVHSASEVFDFSFRHVGAVNNRANATLTVQLRKYANASGLLDTAPIVAMRQHVIAATKEDVLDAVCSFARQKKLPVLSQGLVADAIDAAERHEAWYGNPYSVYGVLNGLTEVSQRSSHTDQRAAIDRAAGRIAEMAF